MKTTCKTLWHARLLSLLIFFSVSAINAANVFAGIKFRNLDLNKEELDSVKFANFIDKKMAEAGASLTFVIGGSYGLSNEVKVRANYSISLSKMTFLHQMTRLILLEQLYRSFKILNNESYHK